jgi:hypothetical protein
MNQRIALNVLPILLAAGILSFPAFAGLSRLPEPTDGINFGTSFYQGARLDFAVYDTTLPADALQFGNASGQGRYVYAYQLFNVYSSSAIAFLSLQGIEEGAIAAASDVGSVEDDDGIAPTGRSLNATKTVATYEFANGDLVIDKNSWFLTIRSDGKPKVGTFTYSPPADDDILLPGANGEIPEPATMSLLLLGAVSMLKRRKR